MNVKRNVSALCFLLLAASVCFANSRPGRTFSFNQNWRFWLGDVTSATNAAFNDSKWRQLDLPHDWSIEGEFSEKAPAGTGGGALPGGIGWYRKTFSVDAASKGKLIFVRIEGNTVIVSSPEVPKPVAVRYAWANNPIANLYNRDSLPASPFRTDDWPGVTATRR